MSSSSIGSSLSSLATNIANFFVTILNDAIQYITQNADVFVTLAVVGLIVYTIYKFITGTPFLGGLLSNIFG